MMISSADSSRLALDTLLAAPSSPARDDAVSFGNQATVYGDSGAEREPNPGMSHDGAAPLGVGAVDNHALFSQVASRLGLGDGRPAPLTQIGRFHVIRRLGEGGMGVVYQAYDPALDRPVAIKLLHPRLVRGRGLAVAEQRMRREARAMARVGHANVVTIHEVGSRDGQLYLVMEYVNGRTLTDWLSEETRSWRATLEMFLRAGEGLAAAHAVDFVHRDFKPDNVLVSDEGDVKVTDFGLASTIGRWEACASAVEAEREVTLEEARDASITRTGALMGTPMYMAPEQLLGATADARSDQFGFSVALYEALVGQRPFAGDSFEALTKAVVRGELQPRSKTTSSAPAWVLRVVERGLRADADDRWPSLEAMLAALRDDPKIRRRRLYGVMGGCAALVLGLGGVRGAERLETARTLAACEAEAAVIADDWGDSSRGRLRSALTASSSAHGAETADKVIGWLDAYVSEWRHARIEACVTAASPERDAATDERARWCLDDKRSALSIYLETFSSGGERAVHRAVTAAAVLPSIAPCGDRQLLARLPAPPPALREELRPTWTQLWRARTIAQAGDAGGALSVARDALARAEELGWPPLRAAARELVGELAAKQGDYAEGESQLERAYFEAASAQALDVEGAAASTLAFYTGVVLGRGDEGLRWTKLADVALEELGGDEAELRVAENLSYRADILRESKDPSAARQPAERALEIIEGALPPDHPHMANALESVAQINYKLERFAEAAEQFERALALRERAQGPMHPAVATSLNKSAVAYADRRRSGRGEALLREWTQRRHARAGAREDARVCDARGAGGLIA